MNSSFGSASIKIQGIKAGSDSENKEGKDKVWDKKP
jgi:hypothetical protein